MKKTKKRVSLPPQIHQIGIKFHEQDVAEVENEQAERFPPRDLAIPGETDEARDGHAVEEAITQQRTIVEVQHLLEGRKWRTYSE